MMPRKGNRTRTQWRDDSPHAGPCSLDEVRICHEPYAIKSGLTHSLRARAPRARARLRTSTRFSPAHLKRRDPQRTQRSQRRCRSERRVQRGRFTAEVKYATSANLYPNVRGFKSAILRNTVYVSVRAMNEKSGTDNWRQPVTKSRGTKTSLPCVRCTWPRATRGA